MKKLSLFFILLFTYSAGAHASEIHWAMVEANDLQPVAYTLGANTHNSFAGQFDVEVLSWTGSQWTTEFNSFGFCVELGDSAGSGYAELLDFGDYAKMAVADLREAAWLIDSYWKPSNTQVENAGLQLAIWNALYNGSFSAVDDPNSTDDDIILAKYNTYYSSLGNNRYMGNEFKILNFTPDNTGPRQDIIVRVVPEPNTMLLMGIGLISLAGIGATRKRTKNN